MLAERVDDYHEVIPGDDWIDREVDRSALIRVYALDHASAGKIAAKLFEEDTVVFYPAGVGTTVVVVRYCASEPYSTMPLRAAAWS